MAYTPFLDWLYQQQNPTAAAPAPPAASPSPASPVGPGPQAQPDLAALMAQYFAGQLQLQQGQQQGQLQQQGQQQQFIGQQLAPRQLGVGGAQITPQDPTGGGAGWLFAQQPQLTPEARLASQGNSAANQWAQLGGVQGINQPALDGLNQGRQEASRANILQNGPGQQGQVTGVDPNVYSPGQPLPPPGSFTINPVDPQNPTFDPGFTSIDSYTLPPKPKAGAQAGNKPNKVLDNFTDPRKRKGVNLSRAFV